MYNSTLKTQELELKTNHIWHTVYTVRFPTTTHHAVFTILTVCAFGCFCMVAWFGGSVVRWFRSSNFYCTLVPCVCMCMRMCVCVCSALVPWLLRQIRCAHCALRIYMRKSLFNACVAGYPNQMRARADVCVRVCVGVCVSLCSVTAWHTYNISNHIQYIYTYICIKQR